MDTPVSDLVNIREFNDSSGEALLFGEEPTIPSQSAMFLHVLHVQVLAVF